MAGILYAIAVILIIFWVVGFLFQAIAGPLIHIALVLGLIVLAYQILTGRRRV